MAARRLILRRHVPDDLGEIIDYLTTQSPDAASRFPAAAIATSRHVRQDPGWGSAKRFRGEGLTGVRSWPVDGFPRHLIYYPFDQHAVIVLAVLHGSRDVPRVLRRRV